MKIREFSRMIVNDWRSVYRYNGRSSSLARCSTGTVKLRSRQAAPTSKPVVDCITFSVVPKMTALWSLLMPTAIGDRPLRILIGDCSGSLDRHLATDDIVSIYPLLNYHHGEKLDIFFYNLCQADYVVVTDDDIFWLDGQPWQWAMEQFEKDPHVAVVSLVPKPIMTSVMRGQVEQPMGSCFIVRRDIFLREQLSFAVDRTPKKSEGWIFDTGEKAQVALVQRGYKIAYAPDVIQSCFIVFAGISSWILKIQKHRGNIRANIEGVKGRPEKALGAIYLARGLTELLVMYAPRITNPVVIDPGLLTLAEQACFEFVSIDQANLLQEDTLAKLVLLEDRLSTLSQNVILGDK